MARIEPEVSLPQVIRTVLAALCACAALVPAASHAVYLSPDGLGQALIFPYYTTRSVDGGNAYNTFVSIVNHTADAKAIRVRFREGKNGRVVGNFNLFLGPRDTWVAALAAPPDNSLPARVLVPDNSCALPAFTPLNGSLPYLDLSNVAYTGDFADGLGTGNDRTREGYVEAIEMATMTGGAAAGVTIGSNGRPVDCTALDGVIATAPPTGGLSGTLTLLNVQSGLDFTVNADALAQLSLFPFYRAANDPYPDFNAGEVLVSGVLIAADRNYRMTWTSGFDAVSAALMRKTVDNELILDSATQSSTDWIVTFPTKRFYGTAPGSAGPFAASLNADRRSIPFQIDVQARDGVNTHYTANCGFTCPPGNVAIPLQLEWASTVVGFRNAALAGGAAGTSGALGSTNAWIVSLPSAFQNGSASLLFDGINATPRMGPASTRTFNLATGDAVTETMRVEGLPAVGFAVRTFRNGNLTCTGAATCQGNYGGIYPHEGRRSVVP